MSSVDDVLEALRDRARSRGELQCLLRVESLETELRIAKNHLWVTRSNKKLWHLTGAGRLHLDLAAQDRDAHDSQLYAFDHMMRSNRGVSFA